MAIRYAHYRALAPGPNGNPVLHNKMGATIAYIEPTAEEAASGKNIQFAVAYCHERDNFNRKLGRTIASNRLKAGLAEDAQDGDYKVFLNNMDSFMDASYGYVRPHILKGQQP